jgi:hypothetical protein
VKYEIGQEVWRAGFEPTTAYVTCPDCDGTARVRVLLPDDTMVSIECEGCRRGYDPADGRVKVYDRSPFARRTRITGVEINSGKTEWQTDDCYRVSEDNLFDNEADCLARAQAIAADHDREERDRINQKEKPLKSWSWHVHYHRECIRRAEKELVYHKSRLSIANIKAKDKATAP